MLQMLSVLRQNLQNLRKSPRVADESALTVADDGGRGDGNGNGNGVMRIPSSIISCFAVPRVNGTDGLWASGDYAARVSEVNHLMVCDGMRYAILM
ncbi:PREDICTED: uncharacterized protein LOC104808855 [Tarenaya hassleriana]|uniref:uncharacterized protein LOC104808855 n=1 Tax=Tarenaya hassleriana TaxID=28532 RepID=UPI00053C6077|nr:PREDICTED: uncharacterized protein LOC104808855 [Tarenaya hassleriana]